MRRLRSAASIGTRSLVVIGLLAAGAGMASTVAPVAVPHVSHPTCYRDFEGESNPLERALFDDAVDGRLDEHSILAASLIASGVEDSSAVRIYEARLSHWVDQLAQSGRVTGSDRERAHAIFEFMHEHILLGGYSQDCTDLRKALDEGRFNCVSATVLFNCLAERFGLHVCGLETRGHAMSRLFCEEGTIDIETTCSRWFRLMDDPQRQAELVRRTLGNTPAHDPSLGRREVVGPQLAAMIFYNRGVDLLGVQQFAASVSANAKALRLDPQSETARGNLLATLNNWAIALGTAGHYAEAATRLEQGMALDPNYATFTSNYAYVHYQWVESLCREGRFRDAASVVDHALEQRPDLPYLHQAAIEIRRRSSGGI
jgi:tetratricopeptide (TPR) repeat protein